MGAKPWSTEDLEYLERAWGHTAVKTIAKHVGRTMGAVSYQVQRQKLGSFVNSSDEITLYSLLKCLGIKSPSLSTMDLWEKRGLLVRHRLIKKRRLRMVAINDFWKWAERNRDCVNFFLLEPLALGAEPAWVAEQRRLDYRGKNINHRVWSSIEDQRLEWFCNHKKTIKEIAKELNRTEAAVARRCYFLGLRAQIRCKYVRWSNEEKELLLQMWREQIPLKIISERFNRSMESVYACLVRLANPKRDSANRRGLPVVYNSLRSLREVNSET